MASKPFIAARIPENLNLKLEEHSKTTGEGKTQALINALSAYLGFAPETESRENAGNRLSLLEKKVAKLERMLKEPHQISLLDNPTVAAKQSTAKTKQSTAETKPDNKTDNAFDNIQLLEPSAETIKFDHHKMAELTGSKYETIRSKHKKNSPITHDGKKYLPFKDGKQCRWRLEEIQDA